MYFLSFGKCLRANIIRQNGARGGGRLGGLDQYSWGELEGGGGGVIIILVMDLENLLSNQ